MASQNRNSKPNPRRRMSVMSWILMGISAILLFNMLSPPDRPDKISYSQFKEMIAQGAFSSITLTDRFIVGTLKEKPKASQNPQSKEEKLLSWAGLSDTKSASRPQDDPSLIKLLDEAKVQYEYKPENTAFRDII